MSVRVRRGFVRVGAGTDNASEMGGNAPLFEEGVSLVLGVGYGGEDGIAGGIFDETDEGRRVCAWRLEPRLHP